ncbi:MAG: hypothetical protein HZB42_03850 [Sphingobacteriales bacterium]|nr:hypothetical protein [Sphingobacteriales bacterium]
MKKICIILLVLPFIASAQKIATMELDSLFNSYFTSNEPGGAVLLVKDGKIIYQNAFGLAVKPLWHMGS